MAKNKLKNVKKAKKPQKQSGQSIPKLTDKSKKRSGRLPTMKNIKLAPKRTKRPKKSSPKVITRIDSKKPLHIVGKVIEKKMQKPTEIDMSDIEKIKHELLRDSESRSKIIFDEEKRIEKDMRKYYIIFVIILFILLLIFFLKAR